MKRLLFLGFFVLATPLAAQEWPDLVGTSRAVVSGDGGHYGASGKAAAFRDVPLTLVFTEQNAGRYVGTMSSAQSTEPKIAVVSSNRNAIFSADSDGHSTGRMIDEDAFELCYTQTSASETQMIASCVTFQRQ